MCGNDLMKITSSDNVIIDIEEITTEHETTNTVTIESIEEDEEDKVENVTMSTQSDSTEDIRSEVSTEEVEVTSNEFENLETNYEERHELARSRSLKLEEVDSLCVTKSFVFSLKKCPANTFISKFHPLHYNNLVLVVRKLSFLISEQHE